MKAYKSAIKRIKYKKVSRNMKLYYSFMLENVKRIEHTQQDYFDKVSFS